MSKITRIEIIKEDLELTRPYTIAFKTVSTAENCFVRMETDTGLIGWGAANPSPQVVGETIEDCLHALQTHAPVFEGKDVRHLHTHLRYLEENLHKNPGARAALDMAFHDLFTQYLEIPLVTWLGQCHQTLPTSITIGIKSVEEGLEEAHEYFGRGFRYLKVKLGKSLEQDVEMLRKLREQFSDTVHIRIDANQGYTPAELVLFYKKTQDLGLELIEQPLPASHIEEMRGLPKEIRDQIAADESLLSPSDAFRLVCPSQACGIFNIKLMKCGGIAPAQRIAAIAREGGVDLMWGCNDESIVSITAALHTALSLPHTRYIDLDGSLDLARDLVEGGFVLKDGMMSVTGRPGLGVNE